MDELYNMKFYLQETLMSLKVVYSSLEFAKVLPWDTLTNCMTTVTLSSKKIYKMKNSSGFFFFFWVSLLERLLGHSRLEIQYTSHLKNLLWLKAKMPSDDLVLIVTDSFRKFPVSSPPRTRKQPNRERKRCQSTYQALVCTHITLGILLKCTHVWWTLRRCWCCFLWHILGVNSLSIAW